MSNMTEIKVRTIKERRALCDKKDIGLWGKIDFVSDVFDLESAVKKMTKLEKKGDVLIGLCPFHVEDSPSFTVDPKENTFHCFGCGINGFLEQFCDYAECSKIFLIKMIIENSEKDFDIIAFLDDLENDYLSIQ